eukprot:7373426-Lingulodinium_polyedra.AAC.1
MGVGERSPASPNTRSTRGSSRSSAACPQRCCSTLAVWSPRSPGPSQENGSVGAFGCPQQA